jgi:NADPH:quinone reductase-like Zn-dependent oxidoreductase
MKAVVCTQYGSPETLRYKEVERPIPKEDQALVKIHAASLNAADFETLRGEFVVRIASPRRPMYKILGSDFAGRIEAIGRNVRQFQVGDEIWGDLSFPLGYSTFAEYVCVPVQALRLKPVNMTFEQAAAMPTAGVVALQNLLSKRPIEADQKVLINGAGGGVGTFAVQIAKHFGAEVTGVDSADKLDMLKSIGADHVIDYTIEDFTRSEKQYDLVLDVVASRSIFNYKRVLGPEGIFIYVGGTTKAIFQSLLLGPLITKIGGNYVGIGKWEPNNKQDLDTLAELFTEGEVLPIIDRCCSLSELPEAMRYLEDGHTLGKVVISM